VPDEQEGPITMDDWPDPDADDHAWPIDPDADPDEWVTPPADRAGAAEGPVELGAAFKSSDAAAAAWRGDAPADPETERRRQEARLRPQGPGDGPLVPQEIQVPRPVAAPDPPAWPGYMESRMRKVEMASTGDDEADAALMLLAVLEPLTKAQRERVLEYVRARSTEP
jgi:hypothetical protein